jgi:hypothetical protein
MKLSIESRDGGCIVRIDGVQGQEETLLNAIRLCRQSAWACQSGECVNIASIAERVDERGVTLTLQPRDGTRLNASGIAGCLRYMLPDIDKG